MRQLLKTLQTFLEKVFNGSFVLILQAFALCFWARHLSLGFGHWPWHFFLSRSPCLCAIVSVLSLGTGLSALAITPAQPSDTLGGDAHQRLFPNII